jgi:glucokinase
LERVISGPGLENIYHFLCERAGKPPKFSSAKEISQAALTRSDPLAEEALELFVRAYGREAGNLALRCLATGGIFLGGGIAPKILPFLKEGPFLEAFQGKGRLSDFVAKVPVYVITHPYPVLLGAALYGRLHLRPG